MWNKNSFIVATLELISPMWKYSTTTEIFYFFLNRSLSFWKTTSIPLSLSSLFSLRTTALLEGIVYGHQATATRTNYSVQSCSSL